MICVFAFSRVYKLFFLILLYFIHYLLRIFSLPGKIGVANSVASVYEEEPRDDSFKFCYLFKTKIHKIPNLNSYSGICYSKMCHLFAVCHSFQYYSCFRVQLKKTETTSLKSSKSHFLCRSLVVVEVNVRVVQLYRM